MFSLIIAKFVLNVLRLMGKGATTLPGRIALWLKPDILAKLSRNVQIVCVTGTNGKTTTCAFIEHYFKSNNFSYFVNKSGANMISGVATAFVENSTLFGRCKKQLAVIECDENSFPVISKFIKARVIVVTNIFRDQLDRYGEITHTLNKIRTAINNMPDADLVLNADCPMTMSLANTCGNNTFFFGTDINLKGAGVSDNLYCPVCSNALEYQTRSYAQLGNYICNNCNFRRPKLDFAVTDLICADEGGSSFLFSVSDKVYTTKINIGGIYNIYNFAGAGLTLLLLGAKKLTCLSTCNGSFGRMENFTYKSKNILLLLVKNPVGFSQCADYVSNIKGDFDMAFALNDKSADGTDVSWIWDANLDKLVVKASTVFTLGTRGWDMALRLKYNNIKISGVIEGEDYNKLISIIKDSDKDFVIFATYTSMMEMRHLLIDNFGGKEFWK